MRRDQASGLPREHDDQAVLRHTLQDDATGRSIATRVLFVHSTADEKVIRQQRQKQIDRIKAEFTKLPQSAAAVRRRTASSSRSTRHC